MDKNIIYLDNAATTFPKPRGVLDATRDCMENYCGNAGRGSHALALKSAEAVYSAREALASLFSASPENVIFTLNTTQALNLAIKGSLGRGGHVLISDMEHNSTLRPLAKLRAERKISYDIFPTHKDGMPLSTEEILSGIVRRMRPNTRLVCAIHTSNICSYSLPIREIGQLCHRHGILFLVDAAQGAGHAEISLEGDNIDMLCLPGHKGLYAPQGVGALILKSSLPLDTIIEGGNGVNSLEASMGTASPERYEGGTLCTPAIVGLCEGARFVSEIGIDRIVAHERALWRRAYIALCGIDGIELYGDTVAGSILLFNIKDIPADDLGSKLSERGICLRTGYHCAPLAHRSLNTPDGGALRMSFSVFNTEGEVDLACQTVAELAK